MNDKPPFVLKSATVSLSNLQRNWPTPPLSIMDFGFPSCWFKVIPPSHSISAKGGTFLPKQSYILHFSLWSQFSLDCLDWIDDLYPDYLVLNQNKISGGTQVFLELELLHHHARRICNARFSLKAAKFSQLKISITDMSLKNSGFCLKNCTCFLSNEVNRGRNTAHVSGFWYMVYLTFLQLRLTSRRSMYNFWRNWRMVPSNINGTIGFNVGSLNWNWS